MNIARKRPVATTGHAPRLRIALALVLASVLPGIVPQLQAQTATVVTRLVAEPARVTIQAGQALPFKITAYDASGKVVPDAVVRVGGPRGSVSFSTTEVMAFQAGSFNAVATASNPPGTDPVTLEIPVLVSWPTLTRLEIAAAPGRLVEGVMLAHSATGFHADGSDRPGLKATWSSSADAIASVDRFGNVTARKPGAVTITASAEGQSATKQYTVTANPVASIAIDIPNRTVQTGDVVKLSARALNASGAEVSDAALTWSYVYTPDDTTVAPGGPGIIDNGLFAANAPGQFALMATSGNVVSRSVIEVAPRDVRRRFTVTSRGVVNTTATSDLWPWTGVNGRDYALVGTWGGDGYGLVYDITDMDNIVKTDSIKIDARTINDVTVSPDGRYGVLAREGASNRVNGVVILDLADPAHPKIASSFSQELTGGVHNMFATNDHLFAISGGQKYVIIDVKDIYNPKYVSEYQHPNARIHDLWVRDGIAYSAQGGVGAVAVDVGNGKYGGTIEKRS